MTATDQQTGGPFDAVVIGSGIAGLSTAAALAFTGDRVLVLERHFQPGGCTQTFRRGEFEWDIGVHSLGFPDRHLDWYPQLVALTGGRIGFEHLGPVTDRISFPGLEVDMPSTREEYEQVLADLFPGERDGIRGYLAEVAGTCAGARGDEYRVFKDLAARRLLAALDRRFPGIAAHVVHTEISSSLSYRSFTAHAGGVPFGLATVPARFQSLALRPGSPIKGLFFCGQDLVMPGVAAALGSALLCSSLIRRRNISGLLRRRGREIMGEKPVGSQIHPVSRPGRAARKKRRNRHEKDPGTLHHHSVRLPVRAGLRWTGGSRGDGLRRGAGSIAGGAATTARGETGGRPHRRGLS